MNNLVPVKHNNELILTTGQLAKVYQTDENNIKNNFNRNKSRFLEGKHYHCLQGSDLKAFKLQVTNSDLQISNMTRTLYLWTERGASRHSKILDTDKAWEQFDLLEETYFRAKEEKEISEEKKPELKLEKVKCYYFHGVPYATVRQISEIFNCNKCSIVYYMKNKLEYGKDYSLLRGKTLIQFRSENTNFKSSGSLYLINLKAFEKIVKYLLDLGYRHRKELINIPDVLSSSNDKMQQIKKWINNPAMGEHAIVQYVNSTEQEKAENYFKLYKDRNKFLYETWKLKHLAGVISEVLATVGAGEKALREQYEFNLTHIDIKPYKSEQLFLD